MNTETLLQIYPRIRQNIMARAMRGDYLFTIPELGESFKVKQFRTGTPRSLVLDCILSENDLSSELEDLLIMAFS